MRFNEKQLSQGFTLIELIIVMSIMTIVLSLVGPLTLKMIDKAQAQSELISLKNSIKKVSYIAFASATQHSFKLERKDISVFKSGTKQKQTRFDYLDFPSQVITFNSRGYPSPETLEVRLLNQNERINLFKLIEGVDAKITQ